MKTFGLLLIALWMAAEAWADFDQANAAFAEKRYAEAASDYEALLSRQGYSAAVLFNLANTYYHTGKIGRAILNYERAQLLAPGDAEIAGNLNVARHKAGVTGQPAHQFSTNSLSWLGSVALMGLAAGLLYRQITKRSGVVWITVSAGVLLAAMFALILRYPERHRGIVVVKSAPAYIAPVTVTQPLFTLVEGQAVAIRRTSGDFLLVETGDGRRGWVTGGEVGQLIPPLTPTERHI